MGLADVALKSACVATRRDDGVADHRFHGAGSTTVFLFRVWHGEIIPGAAGQQPPQCPMHLGGGQRQLLAVLGGPGARLRCGLSGEACAAGAGARQAQATMRLRATPCKVVVGDAVGSARGRWAGGAPLLGGGADGRGFVWSARWPGRRFARHRLTGPQLRRPAGRARRPGVQGLPSIFSTNRSMAWISLVSP